MCIVFCRGHLKLVYRLCVGYYRALKNSTKSRTTKNNPLQIGYKYRRGHSIKHKLRNPKRTSIYNWQPRPCHTQHQGVPKPDRSPIRADRRHKPNPSINTPAITEA